MGWQFSCQIITGRNDQDLSLENDNLIFLYESLYQKGRQFSFHLIAGRNVKELSLGNVLHHTV